MPPLDRNPGWNLLGFLNPRLRAVDAFRAHCNVDTVTVLALEDPRDPPRDALPRLVDDVAAHSLGDLHSRPGRRY